MGTSQRGGGSLYIHPGLLPSWLGELCVFGRGWGSCACLCLDLIIKGNSGIQACWEWWFCLIKTGKRNKQTPPFLLSTRPLHGPNYSARALGLRQRYLAPGAQSKGRCFWIVLVAVVATGRLGGPKAALQGCES